MKLLKQKKFWLTINIIVSLMACNCQTSNKSHDEELPGTKKPVSISPTSKDTSKIHQTKMGSPNEEYDQHKIDSIKQNKIKPRERKGGGKND